MHTVNQQQLYKRQLNASKKKHTKQIRTLQNVQK